MGYLNFMKKAGEAGKNLAQGTGKMVWGVGKGVKHVVKKHPKKLMTGVAVAGTASMIPMSPSKSTDTDIERMQQNNPQQNRRRQL